MSKIEMAVWGAATFVAACLFMARRDAVTALFTMIASATFVTCELFGGDDGKKR